MPKETPFKRFFSYSLHIFNKSIEKILVNWVSLVFIFLLSISLLWLQRFLNIPLRVNLSVIIIVFLSGIVLVLTIAYIWRRVKWRRKEILSDGLLWIEDNSTLEPICPECKSPVIEIEQDIDSQYEGISDLIFHKTREHNFKCSSDNCPFVITISSSINELKDQIKRNN